MNKVTKAYRAAWRWPEVYSHSPAIIWTSRAIAFLIPLALILVTLITGVPVFGWLGTGFLAGFLISILVVVTVKMFYSEYESVENFQSRETRIKEFFHGFPALTDVPITENEPDEWVAYGHVEPLEFICAVQTVIRGVTEDENLIAAYGGLQGSVGHLYARFIDPRESHWSEGIEMCKASGEDCFPITRVTKE